MALTKFTADVNNVSALSDLPNDADGLTAAQLKAVFDKAGSDIKTYINGTLTTQIDAGIKTVTPKMVQYTLPAGAAGGGYADSTSGITSSSFVYCQPTDACLADWIASGVKCSSVTTNQILFTAETAPANDVVIQILILG